MANFTLQLWRSLKTNLSIKKVFSIFAVLTSASLVLATNQLQAASTLGGLTDQPSVPVPVSSLFSPAKSPQLLAQQSRVRRLQFAPGAYSTTLQDAVVRGTRDIYLVGASQGQTMTIKIASIENNASFAVMAPPNKAGQRRTLTPDAVNWTAPLPTSGDYQIVIGSSRGNATYKLQVTIK